MRPTQKQNRTRGRGSRKPSTGSNLNRVFESNGPEGKVRGTPQQIVEKYLSLARDAQTSDDRVVAENFLQHAEHYQRLLLEAAPNTDDRRDHPSEQDQPDVESMDGDTETRSDPERRTPQVEVVRTSSGPERGDRQESDRPESARYSSERNGSARSRRGADVSGLTTIDSGGGDSNSLLVDAEDLSASQPRRRPRVPAPDRQPAAVQTVEPESAEIKPAETKPAETKPSGEASPELQAPTTESQPE
jgi:hypothetical protein